MSAPELVSQKCPKCGREAKYNPAMKKWYCQECMYPFEAPLSYKTIFDLSDEEIKKAIISNLVTISQEFPSGAGSLSSLLFLAGVAIDSAKLLKLSALQNNIIILQNELLRRK